jgi:hypothetical protein
MAPASISDALNELATRFSDFDIGSRRVHNGLIDKRPFLIARPAHVVDT